LKKKDTNLSNDSVVLATQIYTLDRSRLIEKISSLPKEILEQVDYGAKLVFGLN
jgi:mRNA-degrading endonuclease toxin of MazEF toxin-antitoxin module